MTKKEKINKNCVTCPYYLLNQINYNNLSPVFSFRYLSEKYGLSDPDTSVALLKKIALLSQMTWLEINASRRHSLGYEQIAKNSINEPIPDIIKSDTKLIAFRFSGKRPMVGFREKNIFHILWIDKNFTLYDH